MAKCNARFIEKISHLKCDIRSCRCKNFSLKKASGLKGGSGGSPTVFTFISITARGYIGCIILVLRVLSKDREDREVKAQSSPWDM